MRFETSRNPSRTSFIIACERAWLWGSNLQVASYALSSRVCKALPILIAYLHAIMGHGTLTMFCYKRLYPALGSNRDVII